MHQYDNVDAYLASEQLIVSADALSATNYPRLNSLRLLQQTKHAGSWEIFLSLLLK